MPYAQIDISAPRHRKLSMLSDAAFRLWVVALCYCQEHLTDGVLHANAVQTLLPGRRVKPAVIDELVGGQLWDRDPDNGWRVHDYLSWNTSRATIEQQRAKARKRLDRWRAKQQAAEEAGGNASRNASQNGGETPLRNGGETTPIRSATLSTDQDQKQEHRPAGRTRPLRTTDHAQPPNPKLLVAIAHEVLQIDPSLEEEDFKEALKSRAAQLRVPYDAESVRKALDQVAAVSRKVVRANGGLA